MLMDFNNLEQRLGKLREQTNFTLSSEQQVKMMQEMQTKLNRKSKQRMLRLWAAGGATALAGILLVVGLTYNLGVKLPAEPGTVVVPPATDNGTKEIQPRELPPAVTRAIDKVSAKYNASGSQISIVIETQSDSHPKQTIYLVQLQGGFTKPSEPNKIGSKINFSVTADGSKIWALTVYDKGDNVLWEETQFEDQPVQPNQTTKLSYTDMQFAVPHGVEVHDPSNPERIKQLTLYGPATAVKTQNGCGLIVADSNGTNLWLLVSQPRPILDTTGKKEFYESLYNASWNGGEGKITPVWAANPHALDEGRKIVFESNRQQFKSGPSVYVANSDGSGVTLLMDAKKYGYLHIVGASASIVVAQATDKNKILVADLASGKVNEFPLQGFARDISSDGNYVQFEKVVNAYVQPGLWVLDLADGKEMKLAEVPSNVEWGERPACAPAN